mgnify:CR=1 FL=1
MWIVDDHPIVLTRAQQTDGRTDGRTDIVGFYNVDKQLAWLHDKFT